MKKFYVLMITLLLALTGEAQELKFKEKLIVSIASKARGKFPVIFSNKSEYEKTDVRFNLRGDTISFGLKKITDWSEKKILDSHVANSNSITDFRLEAEVSPEEKYLKVDFFPFVKKDTLKSSENKKIDEANYFIENNEFAIELQEGTNLAIPYRRFHAGVLTIPVKIYFKSQSGELKNNVESEINVGFYGGFLFGKKHFLKIPSEKEYRMYERGWSFNGFISFNKQEFDEGNSIENSTFEGYFATISKGFNLAYHYKSFSSFIALGWDTPLSSFGDEWNYKNKPWVGIGLGFDLFK